ncbi:hypothetical protein RI138_02275 [Streptomyces sp. C11-1]|uniref:Terpene synthase n=1 Tax=Streptomyces durocortorensis TaxID=2811104 RepID=A0ABY9VPK4_9ACTN|nr:hypothetical protein [Streptomyces durocortorensis]WNF25723.1 hypothetical protein RI138_02275 [Streptomyces durocortorensis]
MDKSITIPPLWCPLELRVREGADVFDARSLAWMERHGMDETSLSRAAATDTGFLACSWAPDGTEEGVQALSDWLMWALLYDDYYCDGGPHASQPGTFNTIAARMMARALYPATTATGDPAFDAFASSLGDLMRRIHTLADPALAHLCALAHYQWATGTMCGVSDRSTHAVRTMEDHLLIRPSDGASILSGHMIEVADGTILHAHERSRPEVHALVQAAGILLTVPTDLPSYAREQHQQSLESNIVHILAVQNSLSVQEATYQACALLETVMEFFIAMRTQLRKDASPALLRYTDQMTNMVRGTYEWQRFLPRYSTMFGLSGTADTGAIARPETALHDITPAQTHAYAEKPAPITWWWELLSA